MRVRVPMSMPQVIIEMFANNLTIYNADTLAIVRERWLVQRGTDLSTYGENVRDLMRPRMLSELLSMINGVYLRFNEQDAVWLKVAS